MKNYKNTQSSEFERAYIDKCPVCDSLDWKLAFQQYDDRYGQPDLYKVAQCQQCEAFFLLDPVSSVDLSLLYERYYGSFDLPPAKNSLIRVLLKSFPSLFSRIKKIDATETLLSKIPHGDSVLDVGCGFYPELAEDVSARKIQWTGLEIDPRLVETIRSTGLRCEQGSLITFATTQRYDHILLSQVIEHLMELSDSMQKIKKILKKGGRIHILTPNTDNAKSHTDIQSWIHWHVPYHTVIFNKKSMESLAKRHKFQLVHYETFTPTHWQMLQNGFQKPQKGKKNPSFMFQFNPLKYFLLSVFLRITDRLHKDTNACMYVILERK